MSSLVAHVAIGMTLGLLNRSSNSVRPYAYLGIMTLLAILPDFDYFAIWLFHVRFALRFTHSLCFCFLVTVVMWCVLKRGRASTDISFLPSPLIPVISFVPLLLAICSHLLLDMLVGRSLPLLWPFANLEISLPFAILPGASHTGLIKYEFWRNLIIESGILLPVFIGSILYSRRLLKLHHLPEILLVLSMWVGCVFCGVYLQSVSWR